MKHLKLVCLLALFAVTFACGGSDPVVDTPVLSDDASLSLAIVKGKYITLKAPSTTLADVPESDPDLFATRQLTSTEATDTTGVDNYITTFVATDSKATVKAVQYDPGSDISDFANDTAYADEAITVQDFFIIRVIAEDSVTVNYYKIGLTIAP